MGKDVVKSCNCEIPMMFGYKTFYGLFETTTIMCCFCRRKRTRFSEKSAIKAWNRSLGMKR